MTQRPSHPHPHPHPRPCAAACPADCSGHGVCRTIREIAAGGLNKFVSKSLAGYQLFSGVRTPFDYNRWDADKQQTCVCDPGFTGADCGQRMCPRGDDPLTTSSRWCGGRTCTWEKQTFTLSNAAETTFRIGFTDSFNRTHYAYATVDVGTQANGWVETASRSTLLPGPLTVAGRLMAALRAVPGGLLQRVEVYAQADSSITPGTDMTRTFQVEFVGVSGNQAPLTISTYSGSGTLWYNPYHPSYVVGGNVAASRALYTTAEGNFEEIECSGRGLCDAASGLCKCFGGYTGEVALRRRVHEGRGVGALEHMPVPHARRCPRVRRRGLLHPERAAHVNGWIGMGKSRSGREGGGGTVGRSCCATQSIKYAPSCRRDSPSPSHHNSASSAARTSSAVRMLVASGTPCKLHTRSSAEMSGS